MTIENLDPEIVEYVLAAQPAFSDLQCAAGQLAGLLLLTTAATNADVDSQRLLTGAMQLLYRSGDVIRTARPCPGVRPHHALLVHADASLRQAILDASQLMTGVPRQSGRSRRSNMDNSAGDSTLVALRAAYGYLQDAAGTLPGFQIVDFSQGCCAVRPGRVVRAVTT